MPIPEAMPLRLPGLLLSELYPDALILPHDQPQASLPAQTLGGFGKHILILVNQPDAAVIRETDLSFLLNILHACRLGMPDVRLLNLAHISASGYRELCSEHTPQTVLIFGASASDISLPMQFPDYQVQEFQGIRYLTAPPLLSLEKDMPAKKRLWASLKQLFTA